MMKAVAMIGVALLLSVLLFGDSCHGDFFPVEKIQNQNVDPKILSGPPKYPSYYPRPQQQQQQQQQQGGHRPGQGQGQNQGQDLSISGSDQGNNPNYQNHPSISSVDMQLLQAMEKIVSRMDKLDTRVKTLESVVFYLTNNKQKPEQGNCPANFTQIDGIKSKCYHISSFKNPSVLFDWKSATTECAKMNARLVEMITFDDFHRISQYLTKFDPRSQPATDFWTGGLNPGLIWLWSESGQQVDLERRFWNENDNSSKAPGCLKLSYSVRLNAFFFKGSPCSQPQNFICEIMDNKVARALASFEQQLILQDEFPTHIDDGSNVAENETATL